MSFGLVNARTVFQAFINNILRDMLNQFVFMSIISKSSPIVTKIMSSVSGRFSSRLLRNNLFVKLEKSEFHIPAVSFLGFIVTNGSIQMNPDKTHAALNWLQPCSVKQVHRFLGFAHFYRRLMRNISSTAEPLTVLTSRQFLWSEGASQAFDQFKWRFNSGHILTLSNLPFAVEVDAMDIGVGAALSQRARRDILVFFSHVDSPQQ